jgi:parvulin-like peptidyl-prolyl isomerase
VVDSDLQVIAAQFGEEFARKVMTIAPGSWQGPVESSYGLHLVQVTNSIPAQQKSFEEAKADIARKLRDEHARAAKEEYFAGLLNKYTILLDDGIKTLVGSINFATEIAN